MKKELSKKILNRKIKRDRQLARIKKPWSMIKLRQGGKPNDEKKDNILVVSHDASRTGAPILTLNIIQQLNEKYNVYCLLIRGGAIHENFLEESTAVIDFLGNPRKMKNIDKAVLQISKEKIILFAIVNSIVSRNFLEPLDKYKIPRIILIHEFTTYTSDKKAALYCENYSDEVIYSSQLTLDNAIHYCPEIESKNNKVIPQGKSESSSIAKNDPAYVEEKNKIKAQIQPYDDSNTTLVLGAGTIEIRKGIDHFIACAKRVIELEPNRSFRFVWIGHGYEPNDDFQYSCYLSDQINRSKLEEVVSILPSTPYIDAAYELADMFLITARIDPLPNVAIDALSAGLPTLCFEKTTGIANILEEFDLSDECVAPYLRVDILAEKVASLANSKELYSKVSSQSQEMASQKFNMEKYVLELEKICLGYV